MNPTRRATAARAPLGRALLLALCMLAGVVAAWPAHAQDQAIDPPGRVARLSEADGQVWLYSTDTNEWVGIERNRPLTTGDHIATDNGARAEITLGTTTLRVDAATELEIVQLDDSTFHIHLDNGSVAARLRTPQSLAEFGLETDEGRFRISTVGRYRIDRLDQASELTVYNGQAVFEGRNSALPLTTGQHAQFWLDAAGAAQYNMLEPVRDAFASWNDERDRGADRPVATRFVSPEMTGGGDLDNYGGWEQTPDYGPVWTPRGVATDWAPYSAGHWAWVRPWGWTWVDDAPWGFAPFHYGRWVNYRDRWCWAPGTYVARPVYAPALVAWIGGPRVGVSLTLGGGGPPVGWFPLAPHEVYVPSYRTSPAYVRNVNFTHVTNITIINNTVNNTNGFADHREFQNRRFPNAVTVVPASVLTGRQQVGPAAAQWRGRPEVRALVADSRPGPAMNAAPVATPPAAPRPQEGRPPIRPPFEVRAPGARPGEGGPRAGGTAALPGAAGPRAGERIVPQGAAPGAAPLTPGAARGGSVAPNGGAQNAGAPAAPRIEAPRTPSAAANPSAIQPPPRRGNVPREPNSEVGRDANNDGQAPGRRGIPPGLSQRPSQGGEMPRPATPPRPDATQSKPSADPRAVDTQRPTRAIDAQRVEVPKATEAPHAVAPEPRGNRPDAARVEKHEDKRTDDKRTDDKR